MIGATERSRLLREMGLVEWRHRAAAVGEASASVAVEGTSSSRIVTVIAGDWLIVADAADGDDVDAPFGETGTRLFDNLLASVGRTREATELTVLAGGMLAGAIARRAPTVVLLMGSVAAQGALGSDQEPSRLRGRRHEMTAGSGSIAAIVTHHPMHLLRHLADKAETWIDLNLAVDASIMAATPAGPQ